MSITVKVSSVNTAGDTRDYSSFNFKELVQRYQGNEEMLELFKLDLMEDLAYLDMVLYKIKGNK